MEAKAVCVMRTDLRNGEGLKVPKGKLCAQSGHAFVGLLLRLMSDKFSFDEGWKRKALDFQTDSALDEWITKSFTKVVLGVDSEKELLSIYEKAQKLFLNTVLITDNGKTEFAVPTNTCVGIGPNWSDLINEVTGHLRLFQ